MQIQDNVDLSTYTSLAVGGKAERLALCETIDEITKLIHDNEEQAINILGYGTNILISDNGLPGLTLMCRGGQFEFNDELIIADSSAWWDDVVTSSIEAGLWGFELMSGIPSSVGGAVSGNIAAYGQQISDRLQWIEVLNKNTGEIRKLDKSDVSFSYRASSLQANPNLIILRAAFTLSTTPTTELSYSAALATAKELDLVTENLENRREIIMETRRKAGSLYNPNDAHAEHTAGSFFKNPTVSLEQAREIAKFDETGKSFKLIEMQNRIHGGDARRISAALVLLAAGFERGQSWGAVRLHPEHVLKIENTGGAKAQDIYNVVQEIIYTVKDKLGIELTPEVRFIGKF